MELLETAHERINSELSHDLLEEVKKTSPRFFEDQRALSLKFLEHPEEYGYEGHWIDKEIKS